MVYFGCMPHPSAALSQALRSVVQELVDEAVATRQPTNSAETAAGSMQLPDVLNTQALAEYLGCDASTITLAVRSGDLRAKTDTRPFLYRREWVLDWIDRGAALPRRQLTAARRAIRNTLNEPTPAAGNGSSRSP